MILISNVLLSYIMCLIMAPTPCATVHDNRMPSEDEIRAMKVVDLKAELGKLGLPQTGKKDELIDRLLEHLNAVAMPSKVTSPGVPVAAPKPAPVQKVQGTATNVVSTVSEEEAQRLARAARFGIDPTNTTITPKKASFAVDPLLVSEEARQRRIERFGVVEPVSKKSKQSITHVPKVAIGGVVGIEAEKLKERQQRFGVTTSKALVSQEMEEARRLRAERFGKQA